MGRVLLWPLLPLVIHGLRRRDQTFFKTDERVNVNIDYTLEEAELADPHHHTGSSLGYDKLLLGNLSNVSEWPGSWVVAHEHAQMIVHLLDKDKLFNLVHAYSGDPSTSYAAQTISLPEFGLPALKMQHAVPGWDARNEDERSRVTSFPSYLALASSWDKYLVHDVALAAGQEFKTLGANVMLGPAINVHRSTQHEEEFDSLSGEDPTLGSVLVRSWILAVTTHGILSVPKMLGREQDFVHLESSYANITSWDIFYPPFATAIDVGAAGVMCADHEINGLWACRDKEMLERDVKGIMEFKGMVVADQGAAHEYFPYASSYEKGVDLQIEEKSAIPLADHVVAGMRKAATRVISAIWRMNFENHHGCDPPYCDVELSRTATCPEHYEVAMKAAGSAIVLLKNDGILPLDKKWVRRIAVLGPAATGEWHNSSAESPLHNFKARGVDKGVVVRTDLAERVDVCVLVLGSYSHAAHWKLDDPSMGTLESGLKNCKHTIVFLELSGSVLLPWRDQVDAIASAFHAGEEMSRGWTSILFGDSSPSGKLPIGFPDYSQEVSEWWTERQPTYWENASFAYPFGHGLSYANFSYTNLREKPACRSVMCIMTTVTNISPKYSGAEVVQVYFQFDPELNHPTVLRGFHKTKVLAPGASEKVFFPFSYRDVSLYHDVGHHTEREASWAPQETITVLVGSSSRDIRQRITVHPRFG